MLRRLVGYFTVAAAAIAIVGLIMPVSATPGIYWAWTHYTNTNARGVSAMIKVTNPTVVSGSMCGAFDIVFFYNNDWFKVGWCKGQSRAGNTYGTLKVYWEQGLNGVYSGAIVSNPSIIAGSTYQFWIIYMRGTVSSWLSLVGTTQIKTTTFAYNGAQPSVQAEAHDTTDVFQGHFSNLKYGQIGPRSILWYSWDGYAGTGANYPPFVQNIISNTEWSFNGG